MINKISPLLISLLITQISFGQTIVKLIPKEIEASSEYRAGPIENMLDDDLKTFWNPKNKREKHGVGEYFEVEFDQFYQLTSIKMFAGYGSSKNDFWQNNRASKISIKFDDKETQEYELEDFFGYNELEINRKTRKLKITLEEKTLGRHHTSRDRTFLISEVAFYGMDNEEVELSTQFQVYLDQEDFTNAQKLIPKLGQKKNEFSSFEVKGYLLLDYMIRSANIDFVNLLLENGVDYSASKIIYVKPMRSADEVLTFTNLSKKLRQEYEEDIQGLISNGHYSSSELVEKHDLVDKKFHTLFSSERLQYKTLLREQISKNLEPEFNNVIAEMESLAEEFQNLDQIKNLYDKTLQSYASSYRTTQAYANFKNQFKDLMINYINQFYKEIGDEISQKSYNEQDKIKEKYLLTKLAAHDPGNQSILKIEQVIKQRKEDILDQLKSELNDRILVHRDKEKEIYNNAIKNGYAYKNIKFWSRSSRNGTTSATTDIKLIFNGDFERVRESNVRFLIAIYNATLSEERVHIKDDRNVLNDWKTKDLRKRVTKTTYDGDGNPISKSSTITGDIVSIDPLFYDLYYKYTEDTDIWGCANEGACDEMIFCIKSIVYDFMHDYGLSSGEMEQLRLNLYRYATGQGSIQKSRIKLKAKPTKLDDFYYPTEYEEFRSRYCKCLRVDDVWKNGGYGSAPSCY